MNRTKVLFVGYIRKVCRSTKCWQENWQIHTARKAANQFFFSLLFVQMCRRDCCGQISQLIRTLFLVQMSQEEGSTYRFLGTMPPKTIRPVGDVVCSSQPLLLPRTTIFFLLLLLHVIYAVMFFSRFQKLFLTESLINLYTLVFAYITQVITVSICKYPVAC